MKKENGQTNVNANKKRISVKKSNNKAIFYVIGISIPLLFFMLLELALRTIGFGQSTPLFIDNPANQAYLLARPDVMSRYFPYAKNKPSVTMETDFFQAEKPINGIRIVVQGGSTAAGFPYGLGASIAGMLEHRLRKSMPKHHVEVINTAMSAVNSHTLLDLSDDIIEQNPDMVLIYAGHNEFLGILGASSNFTTSNSYWLTRIKIGLKDVRLFQLMQYLYASLSQEAGSPTANAEQAIDKKALTPTKVVPDTPSRTTMMAQVAQNQSIQLDSAVYQAGLAQFESNMSALLAKYKQAGIPVFIAKIASNYKDQAPLKSNEPNQFEVETLKKLIAKFRKNENIERSELTKISLNFELSLSADLHYQFAKHCEFLGHTSLAKKHYELAIAHDLLKFRAPPAINSIIEKLALKYEAVLVDSINAMQARSNNSMVGNELMLEHLHPNLQGYFVIADSFYKAITKHNSAKPWKNIPTPLAWQQRLVLPSEEYYGFAMVQKLKADYPFQKTLQPLSLPKPADQVQKFGLDYFQGKLDWIGMMEENLAYYKRINNKKMTNKTLQILADAMPHHALHNLHIAEALEKNQEFALAIHYYGRAKLAGVVQPDVKARISRLRMVQP